MIRFNEFWGDFEFEAEVYPSGSAWLPWSGRTSRWWWEISCRRIGDTEWTTLEYTPGGGGGAFTLRRALIQATDATFIMYELVKETGLG